MLMIGAHRINHGTYDRQICQQIWDSRELQGRGTFGRGGYAFYADGIPTEYRDDPFVIFQPTPAQAVIEIAHVHIPGMVMMHLQVKDTCFFVVQNRSTGGHVPIRILGFINCEPHFPVYNGHLVFI
jgi:hypothetical protein